MSSNFKFNGKRYLEFQYILIMPMFRYSSWSDKLLMIVGTLLAIAHGSSLPVAMVIFGDMTDSFVASGNSNFPGKNISAMKRMMAHIWKRPRKIQAS
uniref:Uncharacterized protein n=1 Tax=Accipiter nisus TaxID=211598 RepID=A0A8B9MSM8_9AVES